MDSPEQKAFDRKFDRAFKTGVATILVGVLVFLVGVIPLVLYESVALLTIGVAVILSGGVTMVGSFFFDIFLNPRWKR